ncbi:MAG: ATP-binding protein [Planctomycetes bacterium]|nr:ATP-binding protein [Planctomycetota bacterium]
MPVETRHHLTLPAVSGSLEELRGFCKKVLNIHHLDDRIYRQVVLALDEAAANIVEHGYPEGGLQKIEVGIDIQPDRVVIELRDTGIPFNPLSLHQGPKEKGFSKRGYGIHLIRQIMDEIGYRRSDHGENILTMTKRIQEAVSK